MISPRVRRLIQDHERLQRRFGNSPLIRIAGTAGMPPEVYRFTYNIRGLYVDAMGQILARTEHLLEINLTLGYPRRAPQCRMLTPIFHPNFDAASVCIGDFWAPSEALDDLIIRVGRMIAYQEYNTKSPLNGFAARWAAENPHFLPIDSREISPPMADEGTSKPAAAASPEPAPAPAAPIAPAAPDAQPAAVQPEVAQPAAAITPNEGEWPDKVVIS